MGTTYSTSAECAVAAGLKGLSANSFPSTTDVDVLRDDVYSAIGEVIGYGTADVNGVAQRIEKNKVKTAIKTIRKNWAEPKYSSDYDLNLTDPEIASLKSAFASDAEDLGFQMFTPNENQ